MKRFRSDNENVSDMKLKELETDLSKAKDIAELGAKAIDSVYLSMLFDSQKSLAPLLTKSPYLLEIYKNIQELVQFSLKQKEKNSKLEDQNAQLLKNAESDKNTVVELSTLVSSLEKENHQLLEKIKESEKNNDEQQQQMKTLNVKIEKATEKMEELKKFEEECHYLKSTVNKLVDDKIYFENETLSVTKKAEEAMNKNEELQHLLQSTAHDKANLEQQCLDILSEIEEHKKDFGYLQNTYLDANEKIVKLTQSEKNLKKEKEDLMHQLGYDKMQTENETSRFYANESRLKKYIGELEKELKQQKEENSILKTSVTEHTQKIFMMEKFVHEMKGVLENQERVLEANEHLTSEVNTLKNNVSGLEVRNARQAGELKRLCKSREALTLFFKRVGTDLTQ